MKPDATPTQKDALEAAIKRVEEGSISVQKVTAEAALDVESRAENDARLAAILRQQNPRLLQPESAVQLAGLLARQMAFNEWSRGADDRRNAALQGLAGVVRQLQFPLQEACDPHEPEYLSPWLSAFAWDSPANIEATARAAVAGAKAALARVYEPPPQVPALEPFSYYRLKT